MSTAHGQVTFALFAASVLPGVDGRAANNLALNKPVTASSQEFS